MRVLAFLQADRLFSPTDCEPHPPVSPATGTSEAVGLNMSV